MSAIDREWELLRQLDIVQSESPSNNRERKLKAIQAELEPLEEQLDQQYLDMTGPYAPPLGYFGD